jgi:hypothetical protein
MRHLSKLFTVKVRTISHLSALYIMAPAARRRLTRFSLLPARLMSADEVGALCGLTRKPKLNPLFSCVFLECS